MARLIQVLAALLLGLLSVGPAGASGTERWSAHIAEASARFGIPQVWIRRVMMAESGGRTMLGGRPIESHAGAMGLMQLMPGTWRAMRAANGLGADPHDPRDNIHAGTAYLRLMHDRFGYPGLFAAYNAGPGAYAAFLAGSRRLPAETRAYVAQVASGATLPDRAQPSRNLARHGAMGDARARAPALFALRTAPQASIGSGEAQPPSANGSLFIALRTGGRWASAPARREQSVRGDRRNTGAA